MRYDVIIAGAGAAGLFCAASLDRGVRAVILEGSRKPGLKVLASGSGQCNFTHGGDIRDFTDRYGKNGGKIRSVLYRYNNTKVREFFENAGVKTVEREDGKIFPASMKAADITGALLDRIRKNGGVLKTSSKISDIDYSDRENHIFRVGTSDGNVYEAPALVIACGGITYPGTGSDGSIFRILEKSPFCDVNIVEPVPALTPVFVERYPFGDISGIAVRGCTVEKTEGKYPKRQGDILFTHRNLSGPVILDYSRYLENGDRIKIDFLPGGFRSGDHISWKGQERSIVNLLAEETGLPKAFLEVAVKVTAARMLQEGCETELPAEEELLRMKCASLPGRFIAETEKFIRGAVFTVSGKGGYDRGMVTAGGIDLKEISMKTMESKKHPGLHFAGEVLDVDGDTGGYNIQFAFSSGYTAAQHISQSP